MAFFNDFGYKLAGLGGFGAARPVYRVPYVAPKYVPPPYVAPAPRGGLATALYQRGGYAPKYQGPIYVRR